ncbi:MAG TPA: 30S ribosomal protein S2 [Aurantimonas coralicida]|uniref:Small ribosomal subunit protein uS2 n=2 Tax=root TaxID=1 RepID=A0A9C9THL2_9HYPH|nr:30S ribosomal protein S2 [Phycisphaerae bacterium]HEU00841.1 30S ribosomal protein S2 [Aurantimonas coralicida]
MSEQLVRDLIEAGIHFGHRVSRWNPKMKPYIFGKRNLIHIVDIRQTVRGLLLAKKFIEQTVTNGKDVLFVGTKRQARQAIEDHAREVKMHWVTERWLGGTLTNFREIRKRLTRLEELEALEADGQMDTYSKKQGATLRRQMRKIQRNLDGLRNMTQLPGVMVAIDQRREIIAVREANKLGIPVICLLDTDSDPDLIDIPIPGNDDAMRAIELVVATLAEAVTVGLGTRAKHADEMEQEAPRRRSRRAAMGRADSSGAIEAAPAPQAAPAEPTTPPAEAAPQPAPAPAAPSEPADSAAGDGATA